MQVEIRESRIEHTVLWYEMIIVIRGIGNGRFACTSDERRSQQ
jgi:hypothetical protein